MRPSRSSQRNNVEADQPSWKQDRDEWREKMDAWRDKRDALREERSEWRDRGEGWKEKRAEWREERKELMEERKALMEERKEWQEDRKEWREAKREERRQEKEDKENEDNGTDTGGTDTGGTDTGGTDTGGADTGGTDTGGTDTGGTDTGGTDTGGTDTGGTDTGGTDTGGTDTGGTDTGGTDTGGTDTGGTDTGGTDTGGTDTGGTDTGGTDTGGTDTGGTDTGGTDTGGTDTGSTEPEPPAEPQLLTEYTSSAEGSDFNVHIDFVGEWSIELQNSFTGAADYLSSIITGDLMDVMLNGEFVDDITITAELTEIDGAGGILGQAGPTYVRSADFMPVAGMMQFDVADADNFNAMGYWDSIVLHEMTHTLGFGSLWSYKGLSDGLGTDSPTFTGANATAVYEKTFGLTDTNGVPIENDGGAGTAGAHWEESLFGTDLMSGYLTAGIEPELSQLSIASLEDMGYDTIFDYDSFMA